MLNAGAAPITVQHCAKKISRDQNAFGIFAGNLSGSKFIDLL
jgi:hypothetical protein